MKRLLGIGLIGLFLGGIAMPAAAGQRGQRAAAPAALTCDRACLLGIADTYLAALVAHDPKKAPIAPDAKFTEQAQMIAVGEGRLWKYTTAVSPTFKIPVPDPIAGQIGMIVMLKESGSAPAAGPARGAAPGPAPAGPPPDRDIQLALRLKIVNRQITEAEHIMATIGANSIANLQTPRPALLATVPVAERTPRQYMLLIGNAYYDSIVQSDGDAVPYADDCGRRENGMHTAGAGAPDLGARGAAPRAGAAGAAPRGGGGGGFGTPSSCHDQMNTRGLSYITSIDLRRVWIADEEKGLVFGLTMFRQPMESKSVTILNPDGTTQERPMNFNPFDLEAAHIFKIYGGKLHEIEAMGFSLPLYSRNGWSPFIR